MELGLFMKIEKNMRSNVAKAETGNQGPKGVSKGIKGIDPSIIERKGSVGFLHQEMVQVSFCHNVAQVNISSEIGGQIL